MPSMPHLSRSQRNTIESRIDELREEIAELSHEASQIGRGAYDKARHSAPRLLAGLEHSSHDLLPAVRRQARVAEKAARDHPTAAVAGVGLVLLGLAATIIYSRR